MGYHGGLQGATTDGENIGGSTGHRVLGLALVGGLLRSNKGIPSLSLNVRYRDIMMESVFDDIYDVSDH